VAISAGSTSYTVNQVSNSRTVSFPETAAGTTATLVFTLPAFAAIGNTDSETDFTSQLTQTLVLGVTGAQKHFSFVVTAEDGTNTGTVTLLLKVTSSNDATFSAAVSAAGLTSLTSATQTATLTEGSTIAQATFTPAYTSASSKATIIFTLPYGASVVESDSSDAYLDGNHQFTLPGRGGTLNYIFKIMAQDGSLSAEFPIKFTVNLSPQKGFTLLVSANGGASTALTQGSPDASFSFSYDSSYAAKTVDFTLTTSAGAQVNYGLPELNAFPESITLNAAGAGPVTVPLRITSESGVQGTTFTLSFTVRTADQVAPTPTTTYAESTVTFSLSYSSELVGGAR
jgi:hypothetical protein